MATYSKAHINNLRNTSTKMQKDIGNVYQYTGIYEAVVINAKDCLLYTSPSPRDSSPSRMPSSA